MSRVAVALVRDGVAPAGTDAAIDEAGGVALLVGTDAEHAAAMLSAQTIYAASTEWAQRVETAIAAVQTLDVTLVIVPATPDGRDLAPRLAHALGWDLHAGAVAVSDETVMLSRRGGLVVEERPLTGPAVVTLIPRPVTPAPHQPEIRSLRPSVGTHTDSPAVHTLGVDAPDPATIDLAEAPRIVGAGQGLGSKERVDQLGLIGRAIGAALGGTRVASDAGWIPFERQIGTTGVMVRPTLYLAFAVSGATQHTSGLGDPEHIISVNTDASCPMMSMADLAIVSDARAVLDALAQRLGIS